MELVALDVGRIAELNTLETFVNILVIPVVVIQLVVVGFVTRRSTEDVVVNASVFDPVKHLFNQVLTHALVFRFEVCYTLDPTSIQVLKYLEVSQLNVRSLM
jgi:hypothetical protein